MKEGKIELKSYHYYDPVHAYFLVYGFLSGKLRSDVKINPEYVEFDSLNRKVMENRDVELSAISSVNYWKVSDDYYLLRSGSTQRYDVGTIIVSRKKYRRDEIKDLTIAIPGRSFSGYFYYKLFFSAKEEVVIRFDRIIDAVLKGDVDAGLLIPGPTLTSAYDRYNLVKIGDVFEEWKKEAGDLPMPMGSYILKKSFSLEEAVKIRETFQESIDFARNNHNDAFNYAMNFAKGARPEDLEYFLNGCKSIYDMGETGIKAIKKVYEIGKNKGMVDRIPEIKPI